MHTIKLNNGTYEIRTETLQGRECRVVPVVMMREGVHNGSAGPILHTASELGKIVDAWNGIPVTINHPQKEGVFVSANMPDIAQQNVGQIFNAQMEGDKLKAEAWIFVDQIQSISPATFAQIEEGKPLDVSVGVFSEDITKDGEWNGETYNRVAQGYRPDHLALLPDGTGACSWNDGCGIRNNSAKVHPKISVNADYVQIQRALQNALDNMDNGDAIHYLEALEETTFVYRVEMRNGEKKFYKRSYTFANGNVTMGDQIEQVKREVNYIPIMSTNQKPCCPDKVNAIIANERMPFAECDREMLNAFSSEKLEELVQKFEPKEVTVNSEADLLKLIPDGELKKSVEAGLKLNKEKREELTQKIKANSKDVWADEDLAKMDVEMLEKLSKTNVTADYSVNGAQGTKNDVEPLEY